MKCDSTRVEAYVDGEVSAFSAARAPAAPLGLRRVRRRDCRGAVAPRANPARGPAFPGARAAARADLALPDSTAAPGQRRDAHRDPRWRWAGAGVLVGCLLTIVLGSRAISRWSAGRTRISRRPPWRRTCAQRSPTSSCRWRRATSTRSSPGCPPASTIRRRCAISLPPAIRSWGRRIEELDGHPVATLVYRYRRAHGRRVRSAGLARQVRIGAARLAAASTSCAPKDRGWTGSL